MWLLLPPVLAMIGSAITLYLVWRYPDQALQVESVKTIITAHGERQHVTNSVTPPLR
jgi:hypothetical protein